ncbi:MAG: PEP-CTERM sorting domain-containing protein [Pirellulales bacterium]
MLKNASSGTGVNVTLANTGTVGGTVTATPTGQVAAAFPSGTTLPGSGTLTSRINTTDSTVNGAFVGSVAYSVPGDTSAGNDTVTVNVVVGNATASQANVATSFGQSLLATLAIGPLPTNANVLSSTVTGTVGTVTGAANSVGSTARLLEGNITTATTAAMSWRTRTKAEASILETVVGGALGSSTGGFVISDVVSLSGLDGQKFVLDVSYNDALMGNNEELSRSLGALYLAWRDGSGQWVNAVSHNSTLPGDTGALVTNYNGSYAMARSANGNAMLALGSWGVDTSNNTAWAVLDHNSDFAVVPEPSAIVAGGLAMLGLIGYGLRKRRIRNNA